MAPTKLPYVSHQTPRELSNALRDYSRPEFGSNISLLPYSPKRPDDTFWFVCPASDNPAYHYGKFIAKTAEPCGNLFAGICFEKGIGPSAAEFFASSPVGKSWIVRNHWAWNAFFDSLSNGEFDRYIGAAQRAAGMPVYVFVSAAVMNPPERGKADHEIYDMLTALPRQRLYYSYDAKSLSLVNDASDSKSLIDAPSECCSIADLATTISAIDSVDWVWVNVEVGFLLTQKADGLPDWDTGTIWSNTCEPFLDWFR